jgi:hypothetical protein
MAVEKSKICYPDLDSRLMIYCLENDVPVEECLDGGVECGTCSNNIYKYICKEHGAWIYFQESCSTDKPVVINRCAAKTDTCFENMDLTKLEMFCKHGNPLWECDIYIKE